MSTVLLAPLALAICALGFVIIWRDLVEGRTTLWFGNQKKTATRLDAPLLFWLALLGWVALFSALTVMIILYVFALP